MPPVAVVGSGLAGFTAYQTLRRALAGPARSPSSGRTPILRPRGGVRAAAIRQRRDALGERRALPARDLVPGPRASRSVRRRRSPRPLLESVARPLPPDGRRVPRARRASCASGAAGTRASCGAGSSGCARSTAASSSTAGRFRHVLLAPGHPGLNVPEELRDDPRVVHAYEPHDYAPTVTVVGAGLAAATEWLNALAAGAEVVSVRRREPVRRPLNVPRRVLLPPRARGLPPAAGRASGSSGFATLPAPSYPAGRAAGTSRSSAPPREGRFRVEQSRERQRPGDLRDGIPARLPARPAARAARRRARSRDGGRLARARSRTRRCRR